MADKRFLCAGALAVFVACGLTAAVVLWPGGHATAADNPGAPVPAGEAARLAESLDPAAKPALADNKVTQDEYVAAVNAAVACIRSAGYPVTDPAWSAGRLKYTVGGFPSEAALKAAKPAIEACYDEHLRSIDLVWQGSLAR
jgi:hypothetical protein